MSDTSKTKAKTRAVDPRETARRVLEIESLAISELTGRLDESFDAAVRMIVACAGRVVVTGMGKSGIICQKIAATLSATGTPAFFMHPAEAVHGDLGMIVEGDVLVAVSNSGETAEVVRLLELVRRLGARIIALTGTPGSTLAQHADAHLHVGVREEACSLDLVPTASTCAALAMGDALALSCSEVRGFTARDFARVHPGGRLGRRVTLVDALMHRADALPRVSGSAGLREAIEIMSSKRLGMACVVDADDRLIGVLTDGDLRRHVLATETPLAGTAAEAMTRSPATIAPDALATAALQIMEERKITSLPVVDDRDRLLGVIQIHDL